MKTHCIVCKVSHTALEAKRHPNWTTIWLANHFMRQLKKRLPQDIEKICEEHRNPLKLNVCLSEAGTILTKINDFNDVKPEDSARAENN
jgi:hypothetical protein